MTKCFTFGCITYRTSLRYRASRIYPGVTECGTDSMVTTNSLTLRCLSAGCRCHIVAKLGVRICNCIRLIATSTFRSLCSVYRTSCVTIWNIVSEIMTKCFTFGCITYRTSLRRCAGCLWPWVTESCTYCVIASCPLTLWGLSAGSRCHIMAQSFHQYTFHFKVIFIEQSTAFTWIVSYISTIYTIRQILRHKLTIQMPVSSI